VGNIGYSTLTVIPSLKGMGASLTGQALPIMASVGTAGGTRLGENASRAAGGSLVTGVKGMAGPLVGAFAALGIGSLVAKGVSAGIDALGGAITEASDLNESLNAVKVSFGAAAGEITKLGETAASRLGLSNVQFNGIATQFSSFATTIAGQSGNVTGVLDQLTTRGADFASVFNLEVNDALGLFQSGLAGETEPLRRFGIDLSAAAVESYAYANGIGTVGTELTETQKVQARYGSLMAQTAKTQGDFTNTSDQLANSQRIFNAELANIQATIGTAVLPVLTELMQVANAEIIPAFKEMATEMGPKIAEALQQSTPAIIDLMRALLPLLPALIELGVNAIPVVVAVLQLLAPIIIGITNNWSSMSGAVTALFRLLAGDTSVRGFMSTLAGLSGNLGDAFRWAQSLGSAIGNAARSAASAIGEFAGLGRNLFQGLINGVTSVAGNLLETVMRPIRNAVNGVKSFLGIKSPSRLAFGIGRNWGLGYIGGMESTASGIEKSALGILPPTPSLAAPTVAGGGLAGNLAAALTGAPVYVQNPFTGEYLLAKVDERAEGAVARADDESSRVFRNGSR
jgi:phage-related protein